MEKAERLSGERVRNLSEKQKARISEIRKIAEAKVAEVRIMMDEKLAKMQASTSPPQEIEKTRTEFLDRIEKINREADSEAEKAKNG